MATGSNDTRRPPYGKTEYDRPKQAAYSQSAYTQGYPSGGSGRQSYAYAQGGYNAKAQGTQGTQQKAAKKKKPTLKKWIKKLTKRAKPAASVYPEKGSTSNSASAKKPFTLKRFWKKTKRAVVSALRVMARGVYLGVRKLYAFLMGLPPRTLLIGSGAFVAVLATIIILAVSLPGKDSGENAAQQFAALSASETLDSGFADPAASVDPAAGTPSPETSEAPEQTVSDAVTTEVFTEELAEGDDDPVIAEIQARLMELGYMDSDEPTQHFGPLTQSALKTFQRHNGLDDDGICGQTTYTTLMSDTAKIYVMQNGDSGEDVLGIQQRLYELGYIDNKANVQGTFGDKTEEAAKEFQSKNDLKADGKVGSKTLEMLYGEDVVSNAYTLGDENPVIKDCQAALKKLGYITFNPDGVMGKATVTGIKAFQQANGLTRDGALGPVTRDLLLSGDAQAMVLQLGDYGTSVQRLQKRLAELNYLASANATSYFGEITEDAVKAFQKRSGLTQDGKVGAVTLTMIFSSSAKKSATTPSKTKESSSGSSSSGSGSSSSSGSSSGSSSAVSNSTGVEKLVALAESKVGSKYVRGAKGPNTFDCSGFVYWCLKNAGVSTSYMTSIAWRTTDRFQKVSSLGSVQRGDILVFSGSTDSAGHVGIYLGGGKMIDASSSEGEVRRSSSVLNSGGYWQNHFICAYRVF